MFPDPELSDGHPADRAFALPSKLITPQIDHTEESIILTNRGFDAIRSLRFLW